MKLAAAVFALLVTATVAAAPAQQAPLPPVSAPAPPSAAQATRTFGVTLYQRLAREPGNIIISPVSIAGAFGPVTAGAQGETRTALGNVLGFPAVDARLHRELGAMLRSLESDSDGARVSIANGLWLMRGFPVKPGFVATAERSYDAEVESLDFRNGAAAAERINNWVKRETNGRIPSLVAADSLNEMTALVVTNAVHFLGDWQVPFSAGSTRPEPFTLADGSTKPVPLMQGKRTVRYAEDDYVQVVDLPYKGERLSMTLILPKQRVGLSNLELGLNDARMADWLAIVDKAQAEPVDLLIPKLEVENSYKLVEPLTAMGMGIAFDPRRANFRGIAEKDLFISQVIHKTFLRIDEKGTEAAAATGIEIEVTGARIKPPPTFRADHPFLMLIRDHKTGAVLFMGRISDPKSS